MPTIQVVPYDPHWPGQFDALYQHIWPAIADLALALEHVGSTSVPSLAAKPVIDMTIIVADETALREVILRLARLGCHHRGDLGISGREAFTRLPDYPPHNLYAAVRGALALRNHLGVRDALCRDAELARRYGELKVALARQHHDDIDAYVEGKSAFLLAILHQLGFNDQDRKEIARLNRR